MSCEILTDQSALRQVSTACDTELTPENKDIVEKLISSFPSEALGLAAPQIGIFKRICMARSSHGIHLLVNPEITWTSPDKIPSEEGCLSLPDVARCVERHHSIRIRADILVRIGKENEKHVSRLKNLQLKGLDACIIQHECDHLEGVLLIDRPETKTATAKITKHKKKRQNRIKAHRSTEKILASRQAKKTRKKKLTKKPTKKYRNRIRNERRRIEKRVEIQERIKAEKEGLFKSTVVSPDDVES